MNARKRSLMGEILLNHPPSILWWTALALALVLVLMAFFAFGEYTRKEHVTGQIVLSQQSVKHYSPSTGTVLECLVEDGATVRRGDPLFRVAVDRVIQNRVDVQAAILQGIEARRNSLLTERQLLQRILGEEEATLRRRSRSLSEQLARRSMEQCRHYHRVRRQREAELITRP
jgi:membrane fusion protein